MVLLVFFGGYQIKETRDALLQVIVPDSYINKTKFILNQCLKFLKSLVIHFMLSL